MGGYESISENTASHALGDEETLYKAIVGIKSQDYYLRRFALFHIHGKTEISWHWSAFFLTFGWAAIQKDVVKCLSLSSYMFSHFACGWGTTL